LKWGQLRALFLVSREVQRKSSLFDLLGLVVEHGIRVKAANPDELNPFVIRVYSLTVVVQGRIAVAEETGNIPVVLR